MSVQVHYKYALANYPMSRGHVVRAEMSFAYLWALATPFILMICRRFPLTTRGWWRNGVFHLLAAIVCASLKVPGGLADVAESLVSTLDYGILNYSLVLLCHNAVDYYRRYEAGRRKTSELEAQLATARLDALRMQLHPHFLFNSLHAISELVHEYPQTAERMIARLSEFLRLTIEHDSNGEVSLRQELDFLERYLEIEKMRFEDRLQIDFQIDPMALGARVPNLILQPLVENALRHGLVSIARSKPTAFPGGQLQAGSFSCHGHRRRYDTVYFQGTGLLPTAVVGIGRHETDELPSPVTTADGPRHFRRLSAAIKTHRLSAGGL